MNFIFSEGKKIILHEWKTTLWFDFMRKKKRHLNNSTFWHLWALDVLPWWQRFKLIVELAASQLRGSSWQQRNNLNWNFLEKYWHLWKSLPFIYTIKWKHYSIDSSFQIESFAIYGSRVLGTFASAHDQSPVSQRWNVPTQRKSTVTTEEFCVLER